MLPYIALAVGLTLVCAGRVLTMRNELKTTVQKVSEKKIQWIKYSGYGLCAVAIAVSLL